PPFFDMMKEKNYVLRTEKVDEKGKQYEQPLTVTGVLVEDYGKGWYTSEGIIMDINQLKRLEKEYKKINNIKDTKEQGKVKGYEQVYVKVETVDDVEAVETLIKDMGYQTYSMSSQRQEMQKQSNTMQMILGGIGAISLIVAAIGIANTMTMAIYERTKEIGIMKVLGCRLSEIRSMFLIESATIGLMGGVVGIILSFALSIALNQFAPMIGASMGMGMGGDVASKISVIPFWLVMLGLGFSAGVGLLSGLLPANKAVKISALEAIRHE
ncbi:MAG: FtsX-like permease family protein, partial [Oscillospiraceae bacterium]